MFIREVLAQRNFDSGYLVSFISQVKRVLDSLLPVLFGLAVILFFWGLVRFIWNANNPEARAEGRHEMIWGVVAIAVMVSVYGLVAVLQDVFGLTSGANIQIPRLPNN